MEDKRINYDDGTYYYGEVNSKGLPHGDGEYYLKDGTRFEGEFKNGDLKGYCIIYLPSEEEIDGEFDGFHNAVDASFDSIMLGGNLYIGEIKNDVFYGEDGEIIDMPTVGLVPLCDKTVAPIKKTVVRKATDTKVKQSAFEKPSVKPVKPATPKVTKISFAGNVYEGEVNSSNSPHGKGTMILKEGHKYVGEFKDGAFDGKGKLSFASGVWIEGAFKQGLVNGRATICVDGQEGSGEFIGDFISSNNVWYQLDSGNSYSGSILNGRRHGKGVWDGANGAHFEGWFENGVANGEGQMSMPDGSRYTGEYRNGKLHGNGFLWYSDNSSYKGQFKNGKKHGKGVYCSDNGYKYEGDFHEGEQTGYAVIYYANGNVYKGQVVDGNKKGKGVHTWPNGDCYEGDFDNDVMHGYGVYKDWDGWSYSGEFKNDKPNGYGIKEFPDGEVWEGYFENGKLGGDKQRIRSTIKPKNGVKFTGYFKAGDHLNATDVTREYNGKIAYGKIVNGKFIEND